MRNKVMFCKSLRLPDVLAGVKSYASMSVVGLKFLSATSGFAVGRTNGVIRYEP